MTMHDAGDDDPDNVHAGVEWLMVVVHFMHIWSPKKLLNNLKMNHS